jgi:hypothetical protein
MGAKLVARAQLYVLPRLRPNQDDRARIVLTAMCLTAKDTDREPTYFGGSADLARMLGFMPGDTAGERAVSRALGALIDQGVIEQTGRTSVRGKRRWLLSFATRSLGDELVD